MKMLLSNKSWITSWRKVFLFSAKGADSEKISDLETKIASLKAEQKVNAKVVTNLQLDKSNLQEDMKKFQENRKVLESENADLKEKICFERKVLMDEKIRLEKIFDSERKVLQGKIFSCEKTNIKLSKQISDFEKVLIVERDIF